MLTLFGLTLTVCLYLTASKHLSNQLRYSPRH